MAVFSGEAGNTNIETASDLRGKGVCPFRGRHAPGPPSEEGRTPWDNRGSTMLRKEEDRATDRGETSWGRGMEMSRCNG